ncbi:hypothetical protein [Kitasatospora purpeofusca]|uniref:hypothetical protein n=1 Tax=Kitasatospora purpeofusca TaxID=67352 RepID=UPI0036485643
MTTRESVSEHGLTVRAQHRHNPYDHLFDDEGFAGLLIGLGLRRAAPRRQHPAQPHRRRRRRPRDPYPRASMGFVLLDPTAGPWVPDTESVMAVITVGEDAHRFLPKAATTARPSSPTPTCAAAAPSATATPPRSAARSSAPAHSRPTRTSSRPAASPPTSSTPSPRPNSPGRTAPARPTGSPPPIPPTPATTP